MKPTPALSGLIAGLNLLGVSAFVTYLFLI
jgi:hypothetical protein